MEILGALLILFSCISMGAGFVKSKSQHLKTLSDICLALELMRSELSTSLLSLPELCEILSAHSGGRAAEFFYTLKNSLSDLGERDFYRLWEASVKDVYGNLSPDEQLHLIKLGSFLGKYQLSEQLNALDSVINSLNSKLNSLTSKYSESRKLILSLSTAAGLLLLIAVI